MEEIIEEKSISLIGAEPTRIELDLTSAIFGFSRAQTIKNIVVVACIKRKLLYEVLESKFNPIPNNLETIRKEKKRKETETFRQTVKIPKEISDTIIFFQKLNTRQTITITDIVECWVDETLTSLKMMFGGWECLVETVLKVKRGEALDNSPRNMFLMELLTGEVTEESKNDILKIKIKI